VRNVQNIADMREHPVDDCSIIFPAMRVDPLVHDRREGGTETVRHMPAVLPCAIEQLAERIFAHRPLHVTRAGENQFAGTGQRSDRM
jgi:hypothetical protein